MTGFITFTICIMSIVATIVVHEIGHFLAGIIFGIPIKRLKICLWTFPQYVAIKDSNKWISPFERELYIEKSKEFIKSKVGAFFFVAGGFIMQTIVFSAVIIGLLSLNYNQTLTKSITLAIVLQLFLYLIYDFKKTGIAKKPYGDFTSLLTISRLATYIVMIPIILTHLIILYYVSN